MAAIEKIRMKVRMKVAPTTGEIRLVEVGEEVEVRDFTATGLVEQNCAEYVKVGAMTRTVEPEKKAETEAPKNKDEGGSPEDKEEKEEGWEKEGKKVRVHELAKQLGVGAAEILMQAAQLGFGATAATSSLTEDEASAIIKAFD